MKKRTQEQGKLGELAGLLWTWWRGDPLPKLMSLPRLTVSPVDVEIPLPLLSGLENLTEVDLAKPLPVGHRLYVAQIEAVPVAVGCSAVGMAAFGGGRVLFEVPDTNRYLYGFETLPQWRGSGIYPRLLQHILHHEVQKSEHFWILHQFNNTASERGIRKAGFELVCKIYFLQNGGLGVVAVNDMERACAGAMVLGLPLVSE